MPDTPTQDIEKLRRRALLPRYVRIGALTLLGLTVVGIILAFLLTERPSEFRMKTFPATLSKDVIAVVEGYERRESDGTKTRFYVKADKATTFSDNHQELENVYLEVYDDEGASFDRMTSQKAVYVPAGAREFKVYFAGQVDILTRDGLTVKTEQLSYDKVSDSAEAEELVEFQREEVRGSSVGARVRMKEQKLELLSKVQLSGFARSNGDLSVNKIESFKASGGWAEVDQKAGVFRFKENVKISVTPMVDNPSSDAPSQLHADSATAYLENKEVSKIELAGSVAIDRTPTAKSPRWIKTASDRAVAIVADDLKSFELSGNAVIRTAEQNSAPTVISAGHANFDRDGETYSLKDTVTIVTEETDQPTTLKAAAAVYREKIGKVELSGGIEMKTPTETLSAASAQAALTRDRRLQRATARGAAKLIQTSPERISEVAGEELDAVFAPDRSLQTAEARKEASVTMTPISSGQFSIAKVSAPTAIKAVFAGAGRFQSVDSDGRTSVSMTAPVGVSDPADKSLVADSVKVLFGADGQSLSSAAAVGRAELEIRPRNAGELSYVTRVTGPRFDCEFIGADNNLRQCQSGGRSRTVRTPTVARAGRGPQTLESDRLVAVFSQTSRDVERLDAVGNARFTELDRTGASSTVLYTAATGVVALRGGQPSVWDSKARARATEIDVHTASDLVRLAGSVSATYFNQKSAAPVAFSNSGGPVYVTSANAEFRDDGQVGVFTGNARAWQGDNFVRADLIEVSGARRSMTAQGKATSMIYNVRQGASAQGSVPALGSAGKISYESQRRLVTYESGVEIRQGTDVIKAEKVVAELNDRNELQRATAQTSVGLFQPGRRAGGDFAQYDVALDRVVLRGNPATVVDDENGSTEGGEVTVFLSQRKIAGDGRTKPNSSGRIRTVYKVKERN